MPGIVVTGWIGNTGLEAGGSGRNMGRTGDGEAGEEDGSGRTGHKRWSTSVQPARGRASEQEQAKKVRAKKRPAACDTVTIPPSSSQGLLTSRRPPAQLNV